MRTARMDFSLAPMTIADAAFRWRVFDETMRAAIERRTGLDEEALRPLITGHLAAGMYHAIVVGGDRVGVLLVTEDDTISLDQIEILPEFQRRGIATSVITSLIERARLAGKAVTLRVFPDNTGACRLYERLGFVVVDSDDDGLLMKVGGPD